MKIKNPPAVILGMSSNGLSIARSLGKKDIPVIGVDNSKDEPGMHSKYLKNSILFPNVLHEEKKFLSFLLTFGKRMKGKTILFFTADDYIPIISKYRDSLSSYFSFLLPPADLVEAFLDKKLTCELAKRCGLSHPDTNFVDNDYELRQIALNLTYPCIIKPRFSHLWRDKYANKKVSIVNSQEELIREFAEIKEQHLDVIIQQIIPGEDSNVYEFMAYFDNESKPLAYFCCRKLRQYPTRFGVGCLAESIHNESIANISLEFLKKINYKGLVHLEFKINQDTGKPVFLELNLRTSLIGELSIAAGVNIPYIAYKSLAFGYNETKAENFNFKDGIKLVDFSMDLGSCLRYRSEKRLKLLAWLRSYKTYKLAHTHFSINDLRPCIYKYAKLLMYQVSKPFLFAKPHMEKISILFITDAFYDLAGAERNLYEIATRLDRNKFFPIVISLRGGPPIEELRKKGIMARKLGLWRTYDPKAIWEGLKLIKLIKQKKVKIVVTYHESSDFWGGIIARISGVPVIISSRRDMGYLLKERHLRVYRILNGIFDKIVTVSDAVKQFIFDNQNALWSQLTTIRNGVDLEKFSKPVNISGLKTSLGLQLNAPVVGMLAVLRPIKGHNYFIEAASIISKQFPGVYFLIVGYYQPNGWYYKKLKDMVRELKIEKNVIFTGNRTDIPAILSIMDVLALSSINEGFPNAVLEAMAVGKAVVATSGGGTPEAVINGETGILVPPRSSSLLADAIIKLLQDKKLTEKMGLAGKRRAEDIFPIHKMIKDTESLYVTLLREKESRSTLSFGINLAVLLRMLSNIYKLFVSDFFYYSGLYILFKKINSRNGIVKILDFHRVCNDAFDPLGMDMTVDKFEKLIRHIKVNYSLLSLSELVGLSSEERKAKGNALVLTFDDGYRDFYRNVFPILKKYQMPAIVFLTAGLIDKNGIFWYDAIVEAIRMTKETCIDLKRFGLKKYQLVSKRQRFNASRAIVGVLKHMRSLKRDEIVKHIISVLAADLNNADSFVSLLTWNEIKELRDNGIEFGSHGLSHSILTTLSNAEAEYEIRESKALIQTMTGIKAEFFSYPGGSRDDFNERIMRMVEKSGYKAACTLIQGTSKNESRFALRRYCITEGMVSGLFGTFSKRLFESELLGLIRGMHRHKE